MKHVKKMLALVLALVLSFTMAVPTYAAKGIWDWTDGVDWSDGDWDFGDIFRPNKPNKPNKPGKPNKPNKPGKPNKPTVPGNGSSIPALSLVEDETTVANGDMLRAATYAVADAPEAQAETGTVKYFPITMFDYDQVKFNEVLRKQEFTKDLTQWNGMYMGNDNNKSHTYTDTVTYGGELDGKITHLEKVTTIESGSQYVLVSACEGANGNAYNGIYVGVGLEGNNVISVTNNQNGPYANPIAGAAVWTVTQNNNSYRFQNSNGGYLSIDNSVGTNRNAQNITVSSYTGTNTDPDYQNTVVLHNENSYINKNKGYNHTVGTGFTVHGNSASDGNAFYLYKIVDGTKEVSGEQTKSLEYASHNKWTNYTAGTDGKANGNRVYQGLAKTVLDANGQIQFNHLDAGLFTESEFDGKKVYTNVGLPFEYDSTHQRYAFNAKEMGAWFGGTPESNVNLTYSEDPQARIGNQEDTNVAGWFPFDDSTDTPTTECKAPGLEGSEPVQAKSVGENPSYYFGMTASVDFNMTQDGKLKNGDEIDFHFSGDDDVWVFVDGKLVLDMGGIHNRIDGDINFAQGTWSINQTWKSTAQAEDINNGTANTSGNLWETLGTDLTTFAATETHTLSVFYLERGAGASNCELSFNLPMKDYVSVTKDATKDSEGTSLTEKEQETVNNMDFTYTIYRNGEAYANQTYVILNATTGNAIGSGSTNAQGQFSLKNNQTARFTTAFSTKGEMWHVEEMDPGAAFVNDETKWSSTSVTINGEERGSTTGLISNSVEVVGSEEASGKINFLCENILDAAMPNPSVDTRIDRIVIDYGLPVKINVKDNDMFRGDSYEIVGINGKISQVENGEETITGKYYKDAVNVDGVYTTSFGNVKITDKDNGILEYQLTEQLTDVETIKYIVKITDKDENGVGTVVKDYIYTVGTVYVIPATSMYYEENFKTADGKTMILYTKDGWTEMGTSDKEYQEPGVVKTITDSPYGSDEAYMNDANDSNGTSRYAIAESNHRAFKYTFTGTGTSFFARTTNNSGYLRIVVKNGNQVVDELMLDTRFLNNANQVLYNIPVYTLDGLDYSTYTVTVTVCMNGSATSYGTEFWLDGIRVQNPMNEGSENYNIAQTAYSDDGEANVNIVTLRDKLIDAAGFDDNGDMGEFAPVAFSAGDEESSSSENIEELSMDMVELGLTDGTAEISYSNSTIVEVSDGSVEAAYSDNNSEPLIEATSMSGYAVMTDINNKIVSASDYASIGPKQEVYLAGADYTNLANGNKIGFTLKQWDMAHKLYLGLKTPMGTPVSILINGKPMTISNSADCYYNINDYISVDTEKNAKIEIQAVSGVVSITNIKTTGAVWFEIIENVTDNEGGSTGDDIEITVDEAQSVEAAGEAELTDVFVDSVTDVIETVDVFTAPEAEIDMKADEISETDNNFVQDVVFMD